MILATVTNMEQAKKPRDYSGSNNPHWGHKMTQKSRKAISATQKARYDLIRKAVSDDRIRAVVKEEITRYLQNNLIPVNNNKPTNNIPL